MLKNAIHGMRGSERGSEKRSEQATCMPMHLGREGGTQKKEPC